MNIKNNNKPIFLLVPLFLLSISSCSSNLNSKNIIEENINYINETLNNLKISNENEYDNFKISYSNASTSYDKISHFELHEFALDTTNELLYIYDSSNDEDLITGQVSGRINMKTYIKVSKNRVSLDVARIDDFYESYKYYKVALNEDNKKLLKNLVNENSNRTDVSEKILNEIKSILSSYKSYIKFSKSKIKHFKNNLSFEFNFEIKNKSEVEEESTKKSYKLKVDQNLISNYENEYNDNLGKYEYNLYNFDKSYKFGFPIIDDKYEIIVS